MRKLNKKKNIATILGLLSLLLMVGSAAAYFTDMEEAKNHLTIGKVDITLTEPKWDDLPQKEKEDITPNKTLIKDPKVTNTGINDAFVFVSVEVPVANVITAKEDGGRNSKALTELFSWTVNSGWVRIGDIQDVKNENDLVTAHRYLYVYGSSETCTPLKKDAVTPELFSQVVFANVIEGEVLPDGTPMETSAQDINLRAYAIQTTDLTDRDVSDPASVWKVFENQNKESF